LEHAGGADLTNEATADHLWSGPLWGRDGKVLYATRVNAGFTDASVYRIDAATGQKEELTPHEGQSRTNVSAISPDGKTLLVTADRPGDTRTWRYWMRRRKSLRG